MGDVKLFCLLPGWRLEQCFGIEISRESDIDDLKSLISTRYGDELGGVSKLGLVLYCVSIANGDELSRLDVQDNPPLLPRTIIGTLFPDIPGANDYIFVTNGMTRRMAKHVTGTNDGPLPWFCIKGAIKRLRSEEPTDPSPANKKMRRAPGESLQTPGPAMLQSPTPYNPVERSAGNSRFEDIIKSRAPYR